MTNGQLVLHIDGDHLPIPAVSTSSRCAAVPYVHHGSAVRGAGEGKKKH